MTRGRFVLVTGPSGVGKDSLIAYVKERLKDDHHFIFPRRTVTRTSMAEAEDHDSISPEGFAAARADGAYCLHWEAHSLSYGVPKSAGDAVRQGSIAICNVSRTILPQARDSFPGSICVSVTTNAEALLARVIARGRETESEARQRIARQTPSCPNGMENWEIDNSGLLSVAGENLLQRLKSLN